MILSLDFETYSEADIKKVGAQYYARHESTEALMLAYAFEDGPVEIWDITVGAMNPPPKHLLGLLSMPDVSISAFNATFERLILKHCLGIDIPASRFRCSMVRAYGLSFTGGLDDVLHQFVPGHTKDPEGSRLISKFSKPQPANRKVRRWTAQNAPEDWAKFLDYCKQDVEVERELTKRLAPYEQLQSERDLYKLDQKINDEGVPVDLKLVDVALTINDLAKGDLLEKLKDLTGLSNPNSNTQLREWLDANRLVLPNMQKETLVNAWQVVSKVRFPELKEVLRLKLQLAKTSTTKWKAFKRCTGDDGRARGMFQFAGASRTNRWAGRLVQLQNLARGGNTTKNPALLAEIMLSGGHDAVKALYGSPMMALSDTIRAAITAPDGYLLNVSDLGSIESRVVGWISDCGLINDTFATGKDTYKVFAAQLYKVPYEQVTKQQRNFSKPPTLGGAYMLGAKGLIGYADGMGVSMTLEEAQEAVDTFRGMYPEIVALWGWCKEAVFHTTLTGGECIGKHGIKTFAQGEFLMLQLPSGRRIAYHKPQIKPCVAPWKDKKGGEVMIDNFTFMGKDRFTLKWTRISAHAGFITENIIQATARDILGVWQQRADAAGFTQVAHVHDEIIALETTDRVEELNALIREPIEWAPGLLLDADGYVAKRYRKD